MGKILVVEDNLENLNLIQRFLRDRGKLDISIAENAEHALQLVREEKPVVILMDLRLTDWNPPSDGFELTSQIRKLPEAAGTRIIAVSARSMDHEKQEALDAGCDEFITKPLNYPELIQKLRVLTAG